MEAIQAMRDWCNRVGIDPDDSDALYAVNMLGMSVGFMTTRYSLSKDQVVEVVRIMAGVAETME